MARLTCQFRKNHRIIGRFMMQIQSLIQSEAWARIGPVAGRMLATYRDHYNAEKVRIFAMASRLPGAGRVIDAIARQSVAIDAAARQLSIARGPAIGATAITLLRLLSDSLATEFGLYRYIDRVTIGGGGTHG